MKNIHNQNEKKFHYSLRKIGGKGVVSAVIAVGFFFLGTSAVEAADVSPTEAVASSTTNTDKNLFVLIHFFFTKPIIHLKNYIL